MRNRNPPGQPGVSDDGTGSAHQDLKAWAQSASPRGQRKKPQPDDRGNSKSAQPEDAVRHAGCMCSGSLHKPADRRTSAGKAVQVIPHSDSLNGRPHMRLLLPRVGRPRSSHAPGARPAGESGQLLPMYWLTRPCMQPPTQPDPPCMQRQVCHASMHVALAHPAPPCTADADDQGGVRTGQHGACEWRSRAGLQSDTNRG